MTGTSRGGKVKPKPKAKAKAQKEKYHVEVFMKARMNEYGEWEYLVRWAGYTPEDDSWEPPDNVRECERLIQSFWDEVRVSETAEWRCGEEIEPSKVWIAREKLYFKKTFGKMLRKELEEAEK